VRRSAGQMRVIAGGGIREETVQEIVHRSGVREVHVRGTRLARGAAPPAHPAIRLRKSLPADESAWEETDEDRIREFVRLANG
jgi:copper homeostasis protein CutC